MARGPTRVGTVEDDPELELFGPLDTVDHLKLLW